ncbi:MAG TPA: hypothetical protein VK919_08700, partial [Solirubrobacterales bacterium]|nr:hypothetical protein [Solirubrobacterales bacterium]
MIGRLILVLLALVALAAVFYTGIWQMFVLFVWQHPMLSWMPILTAILVAQLLRLGQALAGRNLPDVAGHDSRQAIQLDPTGMPVELGTMPTPAPGIDVARQPPPGSGARVLAGLGAGLVVLVVGLYFTLISPPAVGLEDIEYRFVDSLPERTQPRLLPRSAVRDDPRFADAKEIHLARDPDTGELMWTGE